MLSPDRSEGIWGMPIVGGANVHTISHCTAWLHPNPTSKWNQYWRDAWGEHCWPFTAPCVFLALKVKGQWAYTTASAILYCTQQGFPSLFHIYYQTLMSPDFLLPVSRSRKVVLPHPDGPIIPTIFPGLKYTETPFKMFLIVLPPILILPASN